MRRAQGARTLGMLGRAPCNPWSLVRAALQLGAQSGERRRAAGSLQGEVRVGAEGEPPRPPPGPRRACHWPGRPCGREDDISGRLDYKGASGAADSERTQPAPRSTGTRARTAARPACSALACRSARRLRAPSLPPVCAQAPRGHHAPLPAAGLRPAARAALAAALRSQARGAAEGGFFRGDVGTCEGQMGGLGRLGGCGAPGSGVRAVGAERRLSPLRCARGTAGGP